MLQGTITNHYFFILFITLPHHVIIYISLDALKKIKQTIATYNCCERPNAHEELVTSGKQVDQNKK
jgi:hypothetical protein